MCVCYVVLKVWSVNCLQLAFFTIFSVAQLVFTEPALRPIQSMSCDVRMSLCLFVSLSVRHTLETTLPEGLETSGRRVYR